MTLTCPQFGTTKELSAKNQATVDKKVRIKSKVGTPQTSSGIHGSFMCSNSTIRVLFVADVAVDYTFFNISQEFQQKSTKLTFA